MRQRIRRQSASCGASKGEIVLNIHLFSDTIESNGIMRTLTKQQLERQDFVDNEIFELIQKFFPDGKQLEWNIEIIGEVRDAIENQLVEREIISKKQFYPYL